MAVKLTQSDVQDLKKQGYSDQDISKAIGEIEKEELQGGVNTKIDPRSNSQTSAFSSGRMDDIARYQLELNDLLEQTEHILKGDVVVWQDGMKIWEATLIPKTTPSIKRGSGRLCWSCRIILTGILFWVIMK